MDKQSFPILDQDRWTISAIDIEGRVGGVLDSGNIYFPDVSRVAATAAVHDQALGKRVSSMMEQDIWAVDAEGTVEKAEQVLSRQSSSAVPVMGSNGAIVGIIGPQELAQFLSQKRNGKAVRAWEISRCKMFEVSPDDSVEDVAKLMAENKIDYLAVTELGALKGVVSALDLLQVILKENTGAAHAHGPGWAADPLASFGPLGAGDPVNQNGRIALAGK